MIGRKLRIINDYMKAQATAKLRNLRMSPRKVRLLIDLVRGLSVDKALHQLQFSKRAAARPVRKLIESAVANAAHNDQMDPSTLVVKTAFVDGGAILYRWMPRAFGRATKIRKRTSHITVILEGDIIEKKKDKNVAEVDDVKIIEKKEKVKKEIKK